MYMEVSTSEGIIPKRPYTEEFRQEAARLADSVGGHGAARRLGIQLQCSATSTDADAKRLAWIRQNLRQTHLPADRQQA